MGSAVDFWWRTQRTDPKLTRDTAQPGPELDTAATFRHNGTCNVQCAVRYGEEYVRHSERQLGEWRERHAEAKGEVERRGRLLEEAEVGRDPAPARIIVPRFEPPIP